jgi:hypothetical protein
MALGARTLRILTDAVRDGDEPYIAGQSSIHVGRGRPSVRLALSDGTVAAAGRRYLELVQARGAANAGEHLKLFHAGTQVQVRGAQEFAADRGGTERLLRTFQPHTGDYKYTAAGKRFYQQAHVEFVVHLPVIQHYKRKGGGYVDPAAKRAKLAGGKGGKALSARGEVVLAGFYTAPISFAFPPAFMKEARLRIAAEWAPDDLIATRLLIESGALPMDGLITHQRPANAAPDAYETAFTDPSCLKMILNWSGHA